MSKFSAFQLIGWTPLIELKNIAKKDGIDARLIGKIEPYQPLSSVKDRSALRWLLYFFTSYSNSDTKCWSYLSIQVPVHYSALVNCDQKVKL